MEYKVLVKVFVPEIEKTVEVYLPVNRTISEVCKLLNKLINEISSGAYPIKENVALCNRITSEFYTSSMYVRDTNIRNGAQLVFF